MKTLKIGNLEVPADDYAISGTATLGIRDSGKTVTSKMIAEQMMEAGIPIFVFDAVGKWRWLKTPGKGRNGKGYEVVVVGGAAPDLPLNPHAIEDIIRASIKGNISLVIDLFDPHLSKADWRQIVKKAIHVIHYENKGIRHVFLEEAAEFVPQKPMDYETYAEVEKLVRMGGNASVGITLISPRAQEINKAVLDLCSNLILGCQVGSRAIDYMEKWVERLEPKVSEEITSSLPFLGKGEVWVWTRQNPEQPQREKMPMCRSFHPDRRMPDEANKTLKPIDASVFVKSLSVLIPKIVEENKANDPVELRKEVTRLKKELATTIKGKSAEPAKAPERLFLSKKDQKHLKKVHEACRTVCGKLQIMASHVEDLKGDLVEIETKFVKMAGDSITSLTLSANLLLGKLSTATSQRGAAVRVNTDSKKHQLNEHPQSQKAITLPSPPIQPSGAATGDVKLGLKDKKFLAVFASYPAGLTAGKLMLLAGYKWNGDSRNALSRLRTAGAIVGGNTGTMQITQVGVGMGPFEALPTGKDLLQYWTAFEHFGLKDRQFLKTFIANPEGLTAQQLCEKTGYEWNGDTRNALSRLRTAGVIVGRNTETMKLSPDLQEHLSE